MSDFSQNLLSTYYGFGKQVEIGKTVSIHDSVKIINDETNISIVDDSLENEDDIITKQESKEDTTEQCEEGFSTLDENSSICDEEAFNDEDFLIEYEDITEKICDENDTEISDIYSYSLETNFEKLKEKNDEIVNLENEKLNPDNSIIEDTNIDKSLISCEKFPSIYQSSNDGIFYNLSGTGISHFPKNIFEQFPNLQMLYLEGNKLNQLPDELFTNLKSLQWLDVRNNQITFLPLSIKGHKNLKTILIQRNKMERLPLELGTLIKLKNLQTAYNPLLYPPREILNLGSSEVLKFLQGEWNKNYPDEVIEIKKDEISPKPSTILCYEKNKKKNLKLTVKNFQNTSKGLERSLIRKRAWNYKPSNRCVNYKRDDYLEIRLLWIEKAKEFLNSRSSELQKLMDKTTLKKWRYDRSSFSKSMKKAASRTEEDFPFAVDFNTLPVSIRQNIKKDSRQKLSAKKNKLLEEPITDINKTIEKISQSLNQLKLTEKTENSNTKTDKKFLEAEMQKIVDLQNSIKHLQMYNNIVTEPFDEKEKNQKSYNYPPSIII